MKALVHVKPTRHVMLGMKSEESVLKEILHMMKARNGNYLILHARWLTELRWPENLTKPVINRDVNETPRAQSSSPVDVTVTTTSKPPIGQVIQTDKDSSSKVNFPSLAAVTGNKSRKRLERDVTQLDQGYRDILPTVESCSSAINKRAPSSQSCPKVDAVHILLLLPWQGKHMVMIWRIR